MLRRAYQASSAAAPRRQLMALATWLVRIPAKLNTEIGPS
jgi:hypothetical protein